MLVKIGYKRQLELEERILHLGLTAVVSETDIQCTYNSFGLSLIHNAETGTFLANLSYLRSNCRFHLIWKNHTVSVLGREEGSGLILLYIPT